MALLDNAYKQRMVGALVLVALLAGSGSASNCLLHESTIVIPYKR